MVDVYKQIANDIVNEIKEFEKERGKDASPKPCSLEVLVTLLESGAEVIGLNLRHEGKYEHHVTYRDYKFVAATPKYQKKLEKYESKPR